MDQEDSWYTLTPGIVHQDKPAIFGPQDISPVASHSITGSLITDQLQPPTISSVDASFKLTSSRRKRNRSKQELRSLQRPANKDHNCRDRLTIAQKRTLCPTRKSRKIPSF